MKQADDPNLADLKKMLKRLEKIDPEARSPSPPDSIEPAADNARKLKDAILDRPANDEEPSNELLQLKSLNGGQTSGESGEGPSELPVIVRQSLPATTEPAQEPGTVQTVIIASITAAVVSALATAGTVYWLNLEASRLVAEAPTGPAGPSAAQQQTFSQAAVGDVPSSSEAALNQPASEAAQPTAPPGTGENEEGNTPPANSDTEADAWSAKIETADSTSSSAEPASSDTGAAGSEVVTQFPKTEPDTALAEAEKPANTEATELGLPAANSPDAEPDAAGNQVATLPDRVSSNEPAANVTASADTGSESSSPNEISDVTPPRPQPAGIPAASGEIAETSTETESEPGTAVANATEPLPAQFDSESAAKPEFGPAQPAPAISSARELVAALTTFDAQASEPTGRAEIVEAAPISGFIGATASIGLGDSGALTSISESEAPSTSAELTAPVVAVFEAPEEAPPESSPGPTAEPIPASQSETTPETTTGPAAASLDESAAPNEVTPTPEVAPPQPIETAALDTTSDEASIAAAPGPAAPQLGPGEVALHHAESVSIVAEEPIGFPIEVRGSPEDLAGHYLIISGLKRGARPSSGSELMFDTWRINVGDLPGLKLTVPGGFSQRQHVAVELRRPDGETRQKSTLILNMAGTANGVVAESEEAPGLSDAALRNVDDGEVQIDNGSIRGARVLFRRAADAGSARAAMLLAATYDPNYIAAFKTLTPPKASRGEARGWYVRAAQLGAPGAERRLRALQAE